ncbi:MAG: DUF3325 domain-containing protein, partial [Pseudomonadota bacterium]
YLLLSLASVITVVSFGWLALAMNSHWKQVFAQTGPTKPTQTRLRIMACAGLLTSLWLCLLANHASIAALVWIMLLTGAAFLIGMLLSWKPKVLRGIFPVST